MKFNEGFRTYGRTIKVDGGLKALSARGDIGTSWWSKRFLAVLESLAMGSRLTRGRAYARAGQVLSLQITPGLVTATVQGSRPQPYAVRIGLTVLPSATWGRVELALAEQALFSARLLAGEMPQQIEEVFATVGTPLFPTRSADLTMDCSCPDWGVPCKHLAATFYLLAEAFDVDPFQILQWRGRDRATLLANLRTLRDGDPAEAAPARKSRAKGTAAIVDEPATPPGAALGAALALTGMHNPTLEDTVDRFWVAPVPLPARAPTLATEVDLLLRQLPTPPAEAGGAALTTHLRALYRSLPH